MAVTQREIADKLGISRQIVGQALSGHPRVAALTRTRVADAAMSMGYHSGTNHEARMLAAKRNNRQLRHGVFAVVVSQPFQEMAAPEMPFYAPAFRGMEEEAKAHGMELCLCPMRDGELPRLVQTRSVDGVISFELGAELVTRVHTLSLPCIVLDRVAASVGAEAGVRPDGYRGTYLATDFLANLGHRHIAFLRSPPDEPVGESRRNGYRDALVSHGIVPEGELVVIIWEQGRAGDWVQANLLDRDPQYQATGKPALTAIVCHNDVIAMSAAKQLMNVGLRIPEDISIVGFDDISVQYNFTPSLTSISFDRETMGRRAVQLLCDRGMELGTPCRDEILPVHLVERDSTTAPRRTT